MYRDVNDDGIISALDRTYIGDPNPDFTYGMTNTLSWKNFNLSFLFRDHKEMTYIMLHVSKRKLCLMVKTSPHEY